MLLVIILHYLLEVVIINILYDLLRDILIQQKKLFLFVRILLLLTILLDPTVIKQYLKLRKVSKVVYVQDNTV